MANGRRGLPFQLLRRVLGPAGAGNVPDAELLSRFVTARDEAAFELLLWRHGAMVLGVCRDLLHGEHDAEDAFQAAFLVLVRKAHSINRHESLAGWLYRVATRAARKLRAQAARRSRERPGLDLSGVAAAEAPDDVALGELRPLLHEEVGRLPGKYREPIVLCYFEGKTHEEAARQLGWPKGTVAGRLARARELLGKRLRRRGVVLTGGALAVALGHDAAAAVPAALVGATVRVAAGYAAGTAALGGVLSTRVFTLTEEVLRAMFVTKLRIAAAVVLALGLLGTGAAAWLGRTQAEPPGALAGPKDQAGAEARADGQPGDPEEAADDGQAARQTRRNLREIAVALIHFADQHGTMPANAIYDRNGKPLLSWRVTILPYLGQENLYKQFKLDEPWDTPHNRRLLARMPAVYRIPGLDAKDSSATYYQVFVGRGAAFEEPRELSSLEGGGGGSMMPSGAGGMSGAPGGSGMPAGPGKPGMSAAGSPPPGLSGPPGMSGAGGSRPGGAGSPSGMMGPSSSGGPPSGGAPGKPGAGGGRSGMPMPSVMGMGGPPGMTGGMPGMAATGSPDGGPGAMGARVSYRGDLAYPQDYHDGTANTLLVVEAETPVPWTKPEDLPYMATGRLPRLGPFRHVFHAAFVDTSVYAISKRVDERILRMAITRNGGEVYDRDAITDPVTTTDLGQLRRENQWLEQALEKSEAELAELRRQYRKEQLRSGGLGQTEVMQREQKLLRRELDELLNRADRLRKEMEELKQSRQGPRGAGN